LIERLDRGYVRHRTESYIDGRYPFRVLHEFLSTNRDELIERCRTKVKKRDSPPVTSMELEHGVPLFLEQLVDALRDEETSLQQGQSETTSSLAAIASVEGHRTAALHGKVLLREGYTVDQVVHGYGDLCQAVTELAKEKNAPVTVDEFHTFNRLLDNAIADAVASYAHHLDKSSSPLGAEDLHERLGTLGEDLRKLTETALKALYALKFGNIGLMGATGTLLEDSLVQLRGLLDRSLPEIRLSTGMTTPRKAGEREH
jgi:hypothetical protein